MFNFKQLPPPPVCVNNLFTTKGYQRFFKLFYVDCHGDLSPCNNDSESGRSLVEMLGTLAIMGILTIGGIAGFNYAMDKSKANDILDGINKRAIALSTYTLLGTNITASSLSAEFPNKIGDSTVAVAAEGDGFNLTVSGVGDSVCDKVLDTGLKMASKISLGETMVWNGSAKSDHACAEENTITFAFNAALDNTMTCGYCQHAENNTCVADETCDNGCPGDKPMKSSYGTCYSCNDDAGLPVDAVECAKCPERTELFGYCFLKCSDGEFRNNNGYCTPCSADNRIVAMGAECTKCPNRFVSTDGYCTPCGDEYRSFASEEECAKCSEREMVKLDYYEWRCLLKCPEEQFRSVSGGCYSCSNNNAIDTYEEECHKCSNRVMLDDEICAMKECPEEQFRSVFGNCYPCNTSYEYSTTEEECSRCSEREMRDGKCVLK